MSVSKKWIFLKDDRFLSGANWGLVRNYLPDPVAYPLTADELARWIHWPRLVGDFWRKKEAVIGHSLESVLSVHMQLLSWITI